MRNSLRVMAMAGTDHKALRALPVPSDRRVHAFVDQDVIDRWSAEASGLRPANLSSNDNVITIFGTIGEDFWSSDGGITAKKIAAQLKAIGDREVEVQINSPGGDVFEGIAIYNILREHEQKITVKVMGMAASAASVIAMAGDSIEIGAASFMMIHNTWVLAVGNRHDMRETADFLEPFDQALRDLYAARTGQQETVISKWMDDETYMSGSTAIERGFADALLSSDAVTQDEKAAASAKEVNEIRAMEHALVSSGLTRGAARAKIKAVKGMPDAASDSSSDMQDAVGAGFAEAAGKLLSSLQKGLKS